MQRGDHICMGKIYSLSVNGLQYKTKATPQSFGPSLAACQLQDPKKRNISVQIGPIHYNGT